MPLKLIIFYLLSHFSIVLSSLNKSSKSATTKILLLLYNSTSNLSFEKILEIFKPLLIIFEISLEKILNIN